MAIKSELEAIRSMSPSGDFRTTVDTTRGTKAIALAATTGTQFTAPNKATAGNITFRAPFQVLPIEVWGAVTITGYDVLYLY
jgi:hypothetical protein